MTSPEHDLDELVRQLRSVDTTERVRAARDLGERGTERALSPLLRAVEDPELQVRAAVIAAIGQVGGTQATSVLLDLLGRVEGDADLDQEIGAALARLGPAAVPQLLDALADRRVLVRAWAARTLGHLGCQRAATSLVALLDDPDSHVREAAAAAFARLRSDQAVGRLAQLLAEAGEDTAVRCSAAWSLGESGDPRAFRALLNARLDDDLAVRETVAYVIERLGGITVVEQRFSTG